MGLVEAAKASVVAVAPTGRPARVSLAEALAGFEDGLAEASHAMETWGSSRTEEPSSKCRAAIGEAARRAERVRLEASPQGYEELVAVIDALLEPLDAFREAAEWFHRTERSGR
jgi:hypothetical protein